MSRRPLSMSPRRRCRQARRVSLRTRPVVLGVDDGRPGSDRGSVPGFGRPHPPQPTTRRSSHASRPVAPGDRHPHRPPAPRTSDWDVHLQLEGDAAVNLAVLDGSHATVAETARGQVAPGLLLNFEVEDVDDFHARLQADGLRMLLPLRDEAFGQRHFITQDPNGVLIDVIKPIPATGEFVQQDEASALPQA